MPERKVTHKDFEKLELRVGTIKAVKTHPEVNEYILLIDLGIADQDLTVVVDLVKHYKIEELVGKQVVVLVNINHEVVRGVETEGMLLLTTHDGKPVFISPEVKTLPGVKVFGMNDSTCTHMSED